MSSWVHYMMAGTGVRRYKKTLSNLSFDFHNVNIKIQIFSLYLCCFFTRLQSIGKL